MTKKRAYLLHTRAHTNKKMINNPKEKWAMIIHGQFTEREKEIANKYGKDSRPHLEKWQLKQPEGSLPDWQRQKMLLICDVAKAMEKQAPPHTT